MRLCATGRGAFSTRRAYVRRDAVRLVRAAHVTPCDVMRTLCRVMSQDGKSAIALLPTARENHWGFLVTQEIAFPDFDVVGRF